MTYTTREDADTYFARILTADDWTNATDADKDKALAQAADIMATLNLTDDGSDAFKIATAAACADIAKALLSGIDPEMEAQTLDATMLQISSLRVQVDRPAAHKQAGVPSFTAWRKLLPYLNGKTSVNINRI